MSKTVKIFSKTKTSDPERLKIRSVLDNNDNEIKRITEYHGDHYEYKLTEVNFKGLDNGPNTVLKDETTYNANHRKLFRTIFRNGKTKVHCVYEDNKEDIFIYKGKRETWISKTYSVNDVGVIDTIVTTVKHRNDSYDEFIFDKSIRIKLEHDSTTHKLLFKIAVESNSDNYQVITSTKYFYDDSQRMKLIEVRKSTSPAVTMSREYKYDDDGGIEITFKRNQHILRKEYSCKKKVHGMTELLNSVSYEGNSGTFTCRSSTIITSGTNSNVLQVRWDDTRIENHCEIVNWNNRYKIPTDNVSYMWFKEDDMVYCVKYVNSESDNFSDKINKIYNEHLVFDIDD